VAARRIRAALASDIPALKQLRMAVRENRLDPARVSDGDYVWFVRNGPVWVWEEESGIVGFSAGDKRDGSIWALFVDPAWEGRGIGSALLERACASLAAARHRTAKLETEAGTRATTFYRLRGWTEEGLDARGQLVFGRTLPADQDG
jgi:ribosomal protein S18 acetylase RimI-like enzyme